MDWRVAKSLDVLLRQINAAFPNRDKSADGGIGNAEHASRSSDHNPWVHDHNGQPVVTARDFTNDAPYMDSHKLALALVASRDKRIKYIIDHRQICSGEGEDNPAWVWRPYRVPPNKNPHDHHVHVSVQETEALFDSETPWNLTAMGSPTPEQKSEKPANAPLKYPILRLGSVGPDVARLQRALVAKGHKIEIDDEFGPKTRSAVKLFQAAQNLSVDGVVGVYTWKKLEA